MNAEERQALRERHVPYQIKGLRYCEGCRDDDMGWEANGPFYPCDAIKVLDALEEVLEQVNYDITECDHTTLENGIVKRWWFYCPKCQEMLYS